MVDYIEIDDADYYVVEHHGKKYYIGEEVVLDSNQKEIGFISSRGAAVIVAFDENHNRVGQMYSSEGFESIESDADLIDAIESLRKQQ